MDQNSAQRAIELFVGRGELDSVDAATPNAARACLDRARKRMAAVEVLLEAEHWETAFTTAYDAYRTPPSPSSLASSMSPPGPGDRQIVDLDVVGLPEQAIDELRHARLLPG